MHEKLNDENFLIYCARHYDNPQSHTTEEFIEDLKRIKYIKKLVTKYTTAGELKERLILNHLIVLCNVFGPEHIAKILYLKMKKQFSYVKPFLIFLNVLPEKLYNVGGEQVVDLDLVPMDDLIIFKLRTM